MKMKTLCLILLIHASLQLKCDKTKITAYVGGEFSLICTFDTNRFLFSRKYWCRGDARNTCEILVHSESATKNAQKYYILDAGRRGLFVKGTGLQLKDGGTYWVGIDKIYADVMTSVKVVVTEVPVSKPRLQPLTSLGGRPTCWGQPLTVRCGSAKGTNIRYAWYQQSHPKNNLLYQSSDLRLHCGTTEKDRSYYCVASNDVNHQESDILFVQVLLPAQSSCIYSVNIPDQPVYDCADRFTTSTDRWTTTTATTPELTTDSHNATENQCLHTNQTNVDWLYSRKWTGLPLWYSFLRWGCFLFLLVILCSLLKYAKAKHKVKHAKRQRKVRFRHLAQ
ncbi:uncharacterized protein LOC115422814 [Sphaeramia orbicularis]|uniref:uncharacterized protein LOC115422814 n=1 Tax=Sphaeramia orbicularis TaxID=375764 RepID=UPI00117FEAA9|nr:uncharacterized protein LOC115422814 [Sphaeramia orbicularis]